MKKDPKKTNLFGLLQEDLVKEYEHMVFYLHSSCLIQGTVREEIGEFLAKEARDEMKHVEEFTKMLVILDPERAATITPFKEVFSGLIVDLGTFRSVRRILEHVEAMENEVVERYVERMDQAVEVGGSDGRYVEIFLEDKILDSKETASHVRQMLSGKDWA